MSINKKLIVLTTFVVLFSGCTEVKREKIENDAEEVSEAQFLQSELKNSAEATPGNPADLNKKNVNPEPPKQVEQDLFVKRLNFYESEQTEKVSEEDYKIINQIASNAYIYGDTDVIKYLMEAYTKDNKNFISNSDLIGLYVIISQEGRPISYTSEVELIRERLTAKENNIVNTVNVKKVLTEDTTDKENAASEVSIKKELSSKS